MITYKDISANFKKNGAVLFQNTSGYEHFEFEKALDADGDPVIVFRKSSCATEDQEYEMTPNKFAELMKDAIDDYVLGYRYDSPADSRIVQK